MSNTLSSIDENKIQDEIIIFCQFFFLSWLFIWVSIRIAIEIICNIMWRVLVGIKINFNLKYHRTVCTNEFRRILASTNFHDSNSINFILYPIFVFMYISFECNYICCLYSCPKMNPRKANIRPKHLKVLFILCCYSNLCSVVFTGLNLNPPPIAIRSPTK